MSKIIFKAMAVLSLSVLAASAFADAPSNTKSYQLLNLQEVVSNDAHCQLVYTNLKALSKSPLVFQFNHKDSKDFKLNDQAEKVQSHSYSIVKQSVNGAVVNRVGLGHFMLDQSKINYVIVITADTSEKNFKYLYPMILSSDDSRCHFTALLKPDTKTTANFEKSIESGAVAKKADLAG